MNKYISSGVLVLALIMPLVSSALSDVDTSGDSSCAMISVSLRYRSTDASTGGAVSVLQDFLNSNGYLRSQPTGFFGSMTRSAVIAFQNANGISATPPGFVGSLTRGKIQEIDCNGITATNLSTPTTPASTPPSGSDATALQQQIRSLLETIKSLQSQLSTTPATVTPVPTPTLIYSPTTPHKPYITVLSPNGGETYMSEKGGFTASWNSDNQLVDLYLLSGDGNKTVVQTIGNSINGSLYSVNVSANLLQKDVNRFFLRVCQTSTQNCDDSNASFSFVSSQTTTPQAPTITILSPQKNSSSNVAPNAVKWDVSIPISSTATFLVNLSAVSVSGYSSGQSMFSTTLTRAQAGCSASDECSYPLTWSLPGTYNITVKNLENNASDSTAYTVAPTPYVNITGSSSNQSSDTSLSISAGNTFTVSGTPQNLQGLTYYYGNGYPPSGYYNRAFFFDPIFNNACSNNTEWTMTCTAKTSGSGTFYVEIYANGQIYRSNTVTVNVTN